MRRLSLHPGAFALLTFVLGLAIGLVAQQVTDQVIDYRRRLGYMRHPDRWPETRFEALRIADSIAARTEGEMQPLHAPPIEIGRDQVDRHCAFTFLFGPGAMTGFSLLSVRVDDPRTFEPVGQAWGYRRRGWYAGDTVTLVVPNADCGGAVVMGWSFGRGDPPIRAPFTLHP